MKNGYINIFRSIRDHWIWDDPEKLKWWIDLLMSANWRDSKMSINSQLIECHRGQCLRSLKGWSKRWNISIGRVKRFVEMLQKDHMIFVENMNNKTTRITICNYDDYQKEQNTDETLTENQRKTDETLTETYEELNKKEEELNKNIKKDIYADFIKSFNEIKSSKFRPTEKVRKSFNARIKEGFTVDQMLLALKSAMKSKFHIENNFQYLTPEFFTRSEKIELYINKKDEVNNDDPSKPRFMV